MDISSTVSQQVNTSIDTSVAGKAAKFAANNSDNSFKKEMNKVSGDQANKKTGNDSPEAANEEKKSDNNVVVKDKEPNNKSDNSTEKAQTQVEIKSDSSDSVMITGEVNKQNFEIFNPQAQALIDANIILSEVVSNTNVPVKVDYSVIKMDMNDAQFFTDLVQNSDKTLQNVALNLMQNSEIQTQEIQKNVKVSATLLNALAESIKNKQSFRIDFDKDISVILRVDKDGALSARFIPGDAAVEQYLKQNISTLRQRFDNQELPYKELSYTGQQKRERKNNNNKENGHE